MTGGVAEKYFSTPVQRRTLEDVAAATAADQKIDERGGGSASAMAPVSTNL